MDDVEEDVMVVEVVERCVGGPDKSVLEAEETQT